MFLKNLMRSIPIFLMILVYVVITKATHFSNITYWIIFFCCLLVGFAISKLLDKTFLNRAHE